MATTAVVCTPGMKLLERPWKAQIDKLSHISHSTCVCTCRNSACERQTVHFVVCSCRTPQTGLSTQPSGLVALESPAGGCLDHGQSSQSIGAIAVMETPHCKLLPSFVGPASEGCMPTATFQQGPIMADCGHLRLKFIVAHLSESETWPWANCHVSKAWTSQARFSNVGKPSSRCLFSTIFKTISGEVPHSCHSRLGGWCNYARLQGHGGSQNPRTRDIHSYPRAIPSRRHSMQRARRFNKAPRTGSRAR